MKIFVGERRHGDAQVKVVDDRGTRTLDPRLDLRNHSPDGFEWGYHGSGPAQLALAICVEVVGAERAQRVYQQFKDRTIARLDGEHWTILAADVASAVDEIEAQNVAGWPFHSTGSKS